MDSPLKPRIGISSCLIGNRVRFNGNAQTDHWVVDSLGPYVEFVPVCPEMAMGLGTPREPMRLVRLSGDTRLETSTSARDHTGRADETAERLVRSLTGRIDGFIFMRKSPMCGVERVKVYEPNGIPTNTGVGRFAARMRASFPDIPMIESGRLTDPVQRERFVLRLFALCEFDGLEHRVVELQRFHSRYKFLLMAHSVAHDRELGRIAANARAHTIDNAFAQYRAKFSEALAVPSTLRKMSNALEHVYGFLKRLATNQERDLLRAKIDEYQQGLVPLLVPLNLLEMLAKTRGSAFIAKQALFHPYPDQMKLRLAL